MFIRNRKALKFIALFFAFNLLFNIVLPVFNVGVSIAYGQTHSQGVNPPNIVDLKTGDMNYSVPFIDLPGGYSFSLSYKAGISPRQNSSWVGLGWSMEAGEISRSVNGYPDDYAGPQYEDYYFGTTLPSTPTKQYKPYGCLHGYKMTLGKTVGTDLPDDVAFDTYVSHYPDIFASVTYNTSPSGTPNPTYTSATALTPGDSYFGGSFPNYDGYSVSGGGMNGFMQPLILENPTLYHSSRISWLDNRSSIIRKLFTQSKPSFRFINDFSNTYKASDIAAFTNDNAAFSTMSIDFGSNQLGYQYVTSTDGFRSSDMRLAGSKHVEYYTNAEIADGSANGAKAKGFIGYEGMPNTTARNTALFAGGTYSYNVQDQIGGFSITDANGVTYHYALPVYTYKRYDYTKTPDGKEMANEIAQAYASKWLLTSITGSDFIDKNNNGYADESDWGAWTNFVYGKWTDQFNERIPLAGNHITQNGAEVYSTLKKELYYLDAAYTRSHVVLFPKASRTDANGIGGGTSLRLNSGVLFTMEGINTIKSIMGFSSSTLYGHIKSIKEVYASSGYNTVLDATDLQNINNASATYATLIVCESKPEFDYTLCLGSPTSTGGTGKLTLNSVSYFGRNNSAISPDYDFTYELSTPLSRGIYVTATPADGWGTRTGRIYFSGTSTPQFQSGDILKFSISGVQYHATISSEIMVDPLSYLNPYFFDVSFLGPNIPGLSQKNILVTATQTKNPPYTEGYYDIWGYFKSDYDYKWNLQSKSRKTTPASAAGADVWSLRKISTPTGALIEVEYESDSYSDITASEGKRILNVHPNIGFKPVANQTNYSNLQNDGTYYFGLNFTMSDLNSGLSSHDFKLHFIEPDAYEAIDKNIVVGQTIQMATMSNLRNGGGSNFNTKSANVTVSAKGADSNGPYIIVSIPRNDLADGLPFVDTDINYGYTHCVHLGSYIIIDNKKMLRYGGGIRVKSVSLKGNDAISDFKTTYDYNNRSLANTSGSISYDPSEYDIIDNVIADVASAYPYAITGTTSLQHEQLQSYKILYSELLNSFEAIRYFVPAPEVNYEYVAVKNYGNNIMESTYDEYQYNVFKNTMVKREVPVSSAYISSVIGTHNGGHDKINRYNVRTEFKDLTSQAGLLLSVKTFDQQDKVISKTVFNYSDESSLPSDQGVVGQIFHEQRKGTLTRNVQNGGYVQVWVPPCICYETVYDTWLTTYIDEYTYTIVSSFHRYPTILLSTETTDYLKGLTDKVEYKAYDFYNGAATEVITRDSYGNVFKNKLKPFYRHDWPGIMSGDLMGLKMNGGNNMIAAITENNMYKVSQTDYDNHLATMSSQVNLWTNGLKYRQYNSTLGAYEDITVTEDANTVQSELICRPAYSYVWNSPKVNSDGSYQSFAHFDTDAPGLNPNWSNISAKWLSNPWSATLSTRDVNGNFSSQRFTKRNSLILAEVNNASYNSFTYTGFEDFNGENSPNPDSYLDGELSSGHPSYLKASNLPGILPHTGKYVGRVYMYFTTPKYITKTIAGDPKSLQPGRTYRASAWIHESSASMTGINVKVNGSCSGTPYNADYSAGISQATAKCGSWYLVNIDFHIPADYVSSGGTINNVTITLYCTNGTGYFDDFRFHPLDSDMTGYVYDELTWQLTHTLDKDNFYTRYEYDDNGRLKSVYRETINGEVKIKDYKYNIVK